MKSLATKSPASNVDPKLTIWNCWSSNMIYDDGQPGYRIHAFDELNNPSRTFCGITWQESGLLNLHEFIPGCVKCYRILVKRGLLADEERQRRQLRTFNS